MIVIKWYVLRTLSGKEEEALTILRKMFSEIELVYPRRRISWRKQGRVFNLVRPLFEGYIFVEALPGKIEELDHLLRRHKVHVAWLVYSAGALVPIFQEEKQLIQKLMGDEGIVEATTLQKSDEQLQVVNGPLAGLEHIIKKVSRKNRRITIEIPLLDEKRRIELEGFLQAPSEH